MRNKNITINILFLITMSATIFCTGTYSQNILYNGDFEIPSSANPDFPDGWWIEYCTVPTFVNIELDDQIKHQGNYSLKFSTIAGKTSFDHPVMAKDPDTLYTGGLYKLNYWVKTEGAGVHDVAVNAGWIIGATAEPLRRDSDWTYREAVFFLPESEWLEDQFISLWFYSDSCDEAGSAWYDDIVVEYIGMPPTAPEEESLTTDYDRMNNQVVLNWETAIPNDNPIAYYLIKRIKKDTEFPNICSNPSFDEPNYSNTFADSWRAFSWGSADQQSWTEEVARTGDFSITISSETGGHGFISQGLFLPEDTRGFDVYLKTYIKTKDVEGGSGALIDFQDWYSARQGLYGTNDWMASDAVRKDVYPGTFFAVMFGNYFDGNGGDYSDTKTTGQAWYDDVSAVLFDSIGQTSGLSFTDTDIVSGETYYYTVRAVDDKGLYGQALLDTVETTCSAVDGWNSLIPRKPVLRGNYPNPFNPQTTIRYQLPDAGHVKLQVFDLSGRLVQTLVDESKPAGEYSITWHAEDVSSGIYFYRLETRGFSAVQKCIKLK